MAFLKKSYIHILLIPLSIFFLFIPFFFDKFLNLFLILSPDRSFSQLTILRMKIFFLSAGLACLFLFILFSKLKTLFQKVIIGIFNLRHFLLLCLTITLVLRLLCVFFLDWGSFPDFEWYEKRAYTLSLGGDYQEDGYPTARFPPGYPFFLSSIYRVLGHHNLWAKIANVILSFFLCFLTYRVAKRIKNHHTPQIVLLILCFFPSQIYFTPLLASEILFTFLFLLVLCFLIIQLKENRRLFFLIFSGVLLGLATLTRGVLLVFPLVILFFFLTFEKKGFLKEFLIITFSMFLILLPWMLRNQQKFGNFTLSTNIGASLWVGNNPKSSGDGICPDDSEFKNIPPDPETQIETDRLCLSLALDYIKRNPISFLKLGIRKLINLIATDMFPVENMLKDLGEKLKWNKYIILAVVAQTYYLLNFFWFGWGVFLYLKRKKIRILSLLFYTIVYWMAIHFVFFGMDRFHFPVVPISVIFSAFALNSYFLEEKKDAFSHRYWKH